MSDKKTSLKHLESLVDDFVTARDWQQFHSPKNLAMSLSIESAELMELFQWLDVKEAWTAMKSGIIRESAIDEIADVLIYAIAFCNSNDIDIADAVKRKMKKNNQKYPVEDFKGHF